MGPELQPDVPLMEVLLYGVLNPATIIVSAWLGRKTDQPGKLIIAAFAGAVAGVTVLYFAALMRIWEAPTLGRAAAGVFVVSLTAGLFYAWIGRITRRK